MLHWGHFTADGDIQRQVAAEHGDLLRGGRSGCVSILDLGRAEQQVDSLAGREQVQRHLGAAVQQASAQ